MDKEQQKVLRKAWSDLIENIADIDSIIDYLFSKEAFPKNVREKICEKKGRRERVVALLETLFRKPGVFEIFYDALVKYEEPTAKLLVPGLREPRQAPCGSEATPPAAGALLPPQIHNVKLPQKWPDHSVHNASSVKVELVAQDNKFMRSLFQDAVATGRTHGTMHPFPMQQECRGIFLLINNHDFQRARRANEPLQDREGTEADRKALQALFEGLGFKLVMETDRTATEMEQDIRKQFLEDHKNYDCFACAILSHGERDHIYGVDGSRLPVNSIYDVVMKTNCPTLVGKPKLFFVQACQGDELDGGKVVHDGPAGDAGADNLPEQLQHNLQLKDKGDEQADGSKLMLAEGRDVADGNRMTSGGDIFLAVATISGFQSLRNTVHGSWFMQTLVYIFSRYAHLFDINDLMILINNLVSRAETLRGEKQQPVFTPAAFTRKFYFFPGLTRIR